MPEALCLLEEPGRAGEFRAGLGQEPLFQRGSGLCP